MDGFCSRASLLLKSLGAKLLQWHSKFAGGRKNLRFVRLLSHDSTKTCRSCVAALDLHLICFDTVDLDWCVCLVMLRIPPLLSLSLDSSGNAAESLVLSIE